MIDLSALSNAHEMFDPPLNSRALLLKLVHFQDQLAQLIIAFGQGLAGWCGGAWQG